MKKVFYISITALLALVACTKEAEGPSSNQEDVLVVGENGPMATLTFTATFPDTKNPAETKGEMGDIPVIDNVYVAVFGQSSNPDGGNLQHWAPATLTKVEDANHTYTANYTVTIPLSDEGRVIDFIVNYPSNDPPLFDREKIVLNRFYTEGNNGAYWQRVELPNGIKGKTDKDGKLVLDDATTALLNHIHLVRNFAKITVEPTTATAEFDVEGYTLINVPNRGNLAPMNNGSFDTPYMSIAQYCEQTVEDNFVSALDAAHYHGFMPEGAEIDTSNPGENSMIAAGDGFYMFERTVPTTSNTQTAVIAKLKWKTADKITNPNNKQYAEKEFYYKIEVIGEGGEYVPICRNIWYKINLTGLEGDGEETFDKAFTGAYFGNVSASIETATLNEITDNTSTIIVNRMDFTTVNDNDVVDILFQYKPSSTETVLVEGSDVTVDIRQIDGFDQSIDSRTTATASTTTTVDGVTWGKITVTLKERPTSGMLRGALRIQGNRSGKRVLFRDVILTVMAKADFVSTASDVSVSGDNVTVNIKLPEKLSYGVFPIQVKIEAQNKNLTSNSGDLPVDFGTSAFDPNKNSFYFVKTIQYSDYYHKDASGAWVYTTEYPCTLKRTSNDPLNIKISDKADYFNVKDLY